MPGGTPPRTPPGVYSPNGSIQHTYIATHRPYTVHTAHIQPSTAIHILHIAHTAHIQAPRRHTDYIQCVYSPCMPMQIHIQRIHPTYSHIQSIYRPYTVHTQHMRIPVYMPCAAADARAGGTPVDSTRNPSGTRGPGISAGPRHLDEVERKSARFLFLGRTPQHPLLRRRQTLAAFASSLCSLS
jgi:hypothetical protein